MIRKRKILLVSNGFYPEISPRSYRATELASEFCRQGHEVVVLSKFRAYDYNDWLRENPVNLRMWDKSRFPGMPEFKKRPFSFFSRAVTRFLSVFFEYPAIEDMFRVRKALENESGYDMLISFAVPYPVHWGVAWSRNNRHRIAGKWIADCGDPYMGDVLDSFRHPFYFKYFEKWFCREADYITIPVESARQGYYPEFHSKIRIIPQGFNFNRNQELGIQHKNEIPEFAYAGGFLPGARDPEPLLRCLSELNEPFRFYIFTDKPDKLIPYKAKMNHKLILSGYIPRNELMEILARMDFLINFDNNTSLNLPSKLIDYSIANRPVLNISRKFVKDDLMAFLKGDYSKKLVLPEPENYHIEKIAGLFLDLIG